MAKTQIIRRRISSVKNINQITKAMEMVAASKLRRAQQAALSSRAYSFSALEALQSIRHAALLLSHPLLQPREIKAELLIIFTSDRGLAGAYNSNVLKALVQELQQESAIKQYLIVVGQRGAQFVSRLKGNVEVVGVYVPWPVQPSLHDIRPIVSSAVKLFLEHKVDRVRFLFTNFISLATQKVTMQQLLPVVPADSLEKNIGTIEDDILIEPSAQALTDYVLPRFLEVQLYQAALEASASEQSMRMVAMKNASDNAKDLTDDLTALFNGVRQGAITQELAEISAGAAAVS